MAGKAKSLGKGKGGGEVLPPEKRFDGNAPPDLGDVKAIRREMARVYRFIWQGKIMVEDATKLVFVLDKMVQAVKSEAEMAQLANAYMDAWSGIAITAPAGEAALMAPAPHAQIEGPKQSEKETNDEN